MLSLSVRNTVWICLLSLLSACESHAIADRRVLHEPVPDLQPNEAELALAAAGELSAIEHAGELITEPEGGPLRADEAAMTAATSADTTQASSQNDAPGVRSTVYYPDRQTSLDGSLPYFQVFTPSIAPFKRVTAFDRVVLGSDGRTPGLSTSIGRRVRVPVETLDSIPDARERDRFWGSVVLDFAAGDAVPLPSVSPESRILRVTTEPPIPLRFERDMADNFYAVRGSRNTPTQVRVTFLTDAPRSYFGTTIPTAPADSLRQQVVPLERSIQKRAERFAAELRVQSSDPLPDVLATLTEHFRSFVESKAPPPNTGDTYLDLARGKKGICRHRAYAFVITAQALGIPSRFVQNEAHSWVEVKLPNVGWMRIDLGGAADGLDTRNSDDQPAYRPSEPDPLPRPQAYEDAYAQARPSGATRAEQPNTRHSARDLAQAAGKWVEQDSNAPTNDTDAESQTGLGLNRQAPIDRDAARNKLGLRIKLDHTAGSIYRGGMLQVSGRVTDDARVPVSGMRVEVALGKPSETRSLLLGVAISDDRGYFLGSYGIPTTIDVGEYELRVISPGDSHYLPAVAE